jgi:hypothetical protein
MLGGNMKASKKSALFVLARLARLASYSGAIGGSVYSGLMLLAIAQPAQAFTFFTGNDITDGSTPGAIPPLVNANVARNNFVTAATPSGTVETEDFEAPATNNTFFSSTGSGSLIRGNTTISVTNGRVGNSTDGINQDVSTTSGPGFNTTASGGRLLRISQPTGPNPAQTSVTFTFATPLRAFGLFITDYGNTTNSPVTLNAFVNGAASGQFPQTISNLGDTATQRSVQFFGFTPQAGDPLIASVTFQFTGVTTAFDTLAMDDIRVVRVPVPPQFIGTVLVSILTVWRVCRSKRKAKQADASAS